MQVLHVCENSCTNSFKIIYKFLEVFFFAFIEYIEIVTSTNHQSFHISNRIYIQNMFYFKNLIYKVSYIFTCSKNTLQYFINHVIILISQEFSQTNIICLIFHD